MKKIDIFNLCMSALIVVGDIFYMIYGTLLIKSIVSGAFVLLGAINFIYVVRNQKKVNSFMILMLLGLFFAMLGDILLEIEFIIGAGLFAVGHVFFLFSYMTIKKYCLKDIIISMCIFVPATLVIFLLPIFDFGGIMMQMVCVVYALIISLMTGKAIVNYTTNKTLFNLIVMIGSCLFIFSDIMLLFNVFADAPRIVGILCLATYYPAECFLAYSITKTEEKQTAQE